jgi:hypothetical protein
LIVSSLSSAMLRRGAVDGFLDPIKLADAVERLLGDGRAVGGVHIEELTAHMRPACRLGDAVAGEQLVEAGITVGMDHARKSRGWTPLRSCE